MIDQINAILDRVDGDKVYILVSLALLTLTLEKLGILGPDSSVAILQFLGLGGVAALRSTANKMIPKSRR